jgi:acetyl esterase/lipase
MRDESDVIAAWITVGGISNAFSGAADFYAGRLEMPPQYELLIPALGPPNLYPLLFLRYSPVYTAAQLPPTLIIHTDADKVTPIDQAYQLEAALKAANVPLEVYYYKDVSHYLQIGDDLTEAGQEMYYLILDFAQRYQSLPPRP